MKVSFKSFLGLAILSLSFTAAAFAQDEINRFEGYAGYNYLSIDSTLGDEEDFDLDGLETRVGAHGLNLSATGNFSKYVGVKFDFSTHSKRDDFSDFDADGSVKYSINQFLGGIQIKNNRKDGPTFKPFGHVLAGLARQKVEIEAVDFEGFEFNEEITSNNFALVIGGGLDVKVHRNVDLRVIQFDFNPVFYRGQDFEDFSIPSSTQNNFRVGFGIVFH